MLDQTMRHDGPSLSNAYPFTLPRG